MNNLQSIPWILGESRHNEMVQSPHQSHSNVCPQRREKWGLVKMPIIQTRRSNMGCRKTWSNFWLLENKKTINSPTLRPCYFYSLKFFQNFDCRYCLLTIYTELQLNTAWIKSKVLSQHSATFIALSCFHTSDNFISITYRKFLLNLITSFKLNWCFTFMKKNKRTKKPVYCLLQDGESAGIRSLQTCIVIKLYQMPGSGL